VFHSYLKIALRHLIRDRVHATLNVAGLSVGIAACLVIGLYVMHELGYDRQYPEVDQIYRVVMDWDFRETGVVSRYATVSPVLAKRIQDGTPEIAHVTRLVSLGRSTTFRTDDRVLSEDRAVLCDPDLPSVFGIPFLKGDPESALSSVSSAVMTLSAAKRYFGEGEPIGQTIHALGLSFQVSGIIPDLPSNSHLDFEILLPVDAVPWFKNWDVWGNMAGFTYVRLGPPADFTRVDERIRTVTDRLVAGEHARVGVTYRHHLQPITDIHLRSNLLYDTPGNGKIEYVLLFAGIGVLILLIACINLNSTLIRRFR
jgi:putative ABC transport system permease protein